MKINKPLRILLFYIVVVIALLVLSQKPQPTTPDLYTADAMVSELTYRGQIGTIYGDATNFAFDETHTYLIEDDGDVIELILIDPLPAAQINGHDVEVNGYLMDADPTRTSDAPVFVVHGLRDLGLADGQDAAVSGNERWVNVACRFGDQQDVTPQPLEYFQNIMENDEPGMDHYWRQTSTDLVNIEGSTAYGWYNLPEAKSYYERVAAVNTGRALQLLMRDCVAQAREGDKVDFKQFSGINVMLSDKFGCCAWGGRMSLSIDGENVSFRTTWLPPWAFNELHVIAHEMGHGWGLPHSGGSRNHPRYPYDSAWDIMSGGSMMVNECRAGNNVFKCFQVGTIAYHLDMLGWTPEGRSKIVAKGQSATVTLDALTTVRGGDDILSLRVPTGSGNTFYSVEARTFIGYDRNLPGEAIVLHLVQPGRSEPAQVVDVDDNNNVNDEGAMWLPGEVFEDTQNKIRVEVLSREGTTFTVKVTNGQ